MNARFLGELDVSGLRRRLENNPKLFGMYSYRQEKYAHKDMVDIWVRYNGEGNIGPKFNDEHSSVWYPVVQFLPEVPFICAQLMAAVQGERLGGVLITKLAPGGVIQPHIDEGWHAEYYSKYFVPVKNEPGAAFCWEDTTIDPAPGEVFEFRNDVPHWVVNDSDSDRIAMIVCIKRLQDSVQETLTNSRRQKHPQVPQHGVARAQQDQQHY